MMRYEVFCRKLVLERHYTSAAIITSDRTNGQTGAYRIPSADLSVEQRFRNPFASLNILVSQHLSPNSGNGSAYLSSFAVTCSRPSLLTLTG